VTRRVRTVFLGSGHFGVESLRRLDRDYNQHAEVVGVVTAPPRPAGRGGRLTGTPIEGAVASLNVQVVLRPLRLRDAIADVLALQPELAVLADYGQIVPKPLLELPFGALNLHPSLLPRHRGASPIPATILAGDAETGVTLMKMDAGLDTGPIVAQERIPLAGTETSPRLEELLGVTAADLLDRSLGPWLRGDIQPRPQPEEGATMTRPLRREDGRLDPQMPATHLERHVRAYQPWPGSFFETDLGRIVVWRAAIRPAAGDAPGTVVRTRDGLGLATSDGVLELLDVQPAGGRRMSGEALLRGRPGLVGTSVGSPPASHEQER